MNSTADAIIPSEGPYWLTHARVPVSMLGGGKWQDHADFEGLVTCNIELRADGMFGQIHVDHGGPGYARESVGVLENHSGDIGVEHSSVNLAGRVVMTRFAEVHAHIDKTQTWERAPNRDGSFAGAKAGAKSDRTEPWSFEDAYRRMQFALECAYAHGTRSIRTHIDSQRKRTKPSWQVFDTLRREWAGRITLQGVISLGAAKIMGAYGDKVADLAAEYGASLGPVIYNGKNQQAEIERSFELARSRGLALDFHVDETLDPSANGLEVIAKTAIKTGFPYPVNCGHACSLSMKKPAEIDRILNRVREAGISIVGLPMTNLYLQDRVNETGPQFRAMTPVRRAVEAGVRVAVGGDNCRDAFHPYGDYDMMEVLREAMRLGHLDNPAGRYCALAGYDAEKIMGLDEPAMIAEGHMADMVIFQANSLSQLFTRLGAARRIINQGREIYPILPDLWDL